MPRLAWGLLLDGSAEMSRPHCLNNPAWRVRYPDPDEVDRWLSCAGDAGELIALAAADFWIPAQSVLASIVPLELPPLTNLSGTCADVLGCICTSLSVNPAILAETLVHEAAHTTLHVLSDATAYWRVIDSAQPYRSPWRKDLRPISGMLHGIFAFLAVAGFWANLRQCGAANQFDGLARFRLRTVTRQVQVAIAEVKAATELTDAGRDLLAAADHLNQKLCEASRAYAPTPQEEKEIEERLVRHEVALATPQRAAGQATTPRIDAAWSRQLAMPMPPPINHRALRLVRREMVSDGVHRAVLKGDAVVADWEDLLQTTVESGSEPESAALMRGSICYGRGDFVAAVMAYADYVERRWSDMDAWRLLGAALRRAGHPTAALAIAFDVDKLQGRTADGFREQFGLQWPFHLHRIAIHDA